MDFKTIHDLLRTHAEQSPSSVAIEALNCPPLTYTDLFSQVKTIVSELNSLGLQRNDRIGLVLPSGPEMTVAFIATIAGFTAAPLNTAYRANEFEFYLTDLNAKAIVLLANEESPAREVAKKMGIMLLELEPINSQPAGSFTLSIDGEILQDKVSPSFAKLDDIAMVSHTSGTTAKPKIVPCTQTNILAGAALTAQSLELDRSDRYLRTMPLSHTHGLITTLASIYSGGTVFASPNFDPIEFLNWFKAFQPTWYSAAPTLHQAILQAAAESDFAFPSSLRFIRSSAAALPPRVHSQLEKVFEVPIIEGYGLSESLLYLTNNPLDKQKPGSVGRAVGTEIRILNEEGDPLPAGDRGEIVVRGPNIISGYENNPEVNTKTFKDGWFRTGDIGHLDEDQFLYITGRIKEMINRGGQKIAPLEVDEVLKSHPDISEAVSFAVPHPTLGEDIAAAVILHAGSRTTAIDVRKFANARLAPYKVPSQVIVVDKIPTGPTGKFQRISLAQELADKLNTEFVLPRNWVEKQIAAIWSEVLQLEQVGVNDNFFALGGHSLFAAQIATRIRRDMQLGLTLNTLFEAPTIASLAEVLQEKPKSKATIRPNSIPPVIHTSAPSDREHFVPVEASRNGASKKHDIDFSLIFFSADGTATKDNKYQLFLDSVRFADQHGFHAVWTPERHFHPFGGLYPNPSVLAAAMATMTQTIQIRAGSVVIPFHDPLRIAEDWSVIDNLSNGRVGIACASGWHTNDFVLAPDDFENRKQILEERIAEVQKLWRGESVSRLNGSQKPTEVRIYPDPIQPTLPMWLASHSDATFIKAGELGLHVLTVLWDTNIEELSRKIDLYHKALRENGYDPDSKSVTLMMHTFVDESMEVVQEKVSSAYGEYLQTNLGLQQDQVKGSNQSIELNHDEQEFLISQATEQLFQTRGLVGTPEICIEKVKVLKAIGVTEIACLIDFGIDTPSMMKSLTKLHEVKDAFHNQPLESIEMESGSL